MRTIRFGNEDVPVLHRRWRQAAFADGYRMTYRLRPGERSLNGIGRGRRRRQAVVAVATTA